LADQALKQDAGKVRLSLVPASIVEAIARVRQYGLNKYGEDKSWKQVEPERFMDAFLRHVLEMWQNGMNAIDDESKLPSMWHAACNLAFLIELTEGEKNENLEV